MPMTLRCAVCNNDAASVVCHHCGKPLCNDNKCHFKVINDNAFSNSTKAFHCRECKNKYHSKLISDR